MRDDGGVAGRRDDEMQMGGAVRVAPQAGQQLADRAVVGYRIVAWLDRLEPVAAVRVAGKHAAQIVFGLNTLLLHVVKAVVIGLPYFQRGAGHRLAVQSRDAPQHHHRLALAVLADIGAQRVMGRIGDIERAEDGVRRGGAGAAMVDGVDQHRYAQHVRQQDVFLAPVRAHLACFRQEFDCGQPFLVRGFDFLDGGVQVAHQGAHDLAQTRADVGAHAGVDDLGGTGFVKIAGCVLLPGRGWRVHDLSPVCFLLLLFETSIY